VGDLLWPLLPSPLPARPVAGHLRGPAPRGAATPLGKTLILPPLAAGVTNAVSERVPGLTIRGWLTPPHRPAIRFLFVRSGVCRRLPPHPASRRRSCPWLAIPVVTARRGLPPPTSAPCQAHHRRIGMLRIPIHWPLIHLYEQPEPLDRTQEGVGLEFGAGLGAAS